MFQCILTQVICDLMTSPTACFKGPKPVEVWYLGVTRKRLYPLENGEGIESYM